MASTVNIPIDINFGLRSRIGQKIRDLAPALSKEWAMSQESDLLRAARRRSPVKTGYMRRRLFTHVSAGGFIFPAIHVGGRAHYTKFQNEGTVRIKPRLFIDKAIRVVFPRTTVTSRPWRREVKPSRS